MRTTAKDEQNRSPLPWFELPVALPDDFPLSCSGRFIQGDDPITFVHRHNVTEIGFCHHGQGVWVIGSTIVPFAKGDVSIITSDETHLARSICGTTSEWTWLYCDPYRLFSAPSPYSPPPSLNRFRGEGFTHILTREHNAELVALIESIINEYQSCKAFYREVIFGKLYTFFQLLQRQTPPCCAPAITTDAVRTDAARVWAAVEHMLRHYTERCDSDFLARLCCMSATTFRRTFKRCMKMTPRDYANVVRLSMAELELRSSKRKVSDIALRCGFETLSAFNRLFRLKNGMTPRMWREN